MFLIYKYTNTQNGKGYIGLTKNEQSRKCNHRATSGNCRAFYNAIKKYGFNSFGYEILEDKIPTKELAEEREIFYIQENSTYSNGYNLTVGGFCGGAPGGENSPHAKLTKQQVTRIIADSRPNCKLAREFNVSDETIRRIRKGKTWKHVDRSNTPKYEKGFRLTEKTKELIRNDTRSNVEMSNILNIDSSLISYYRKGASIHYESKKHLVTEQDASKAIHDSRSHSDMAKELGISVSSIKSIRYGMRWKHLDRSRSAGPWVTQTRAI